MSSFVKDFVSTIKHSALSMFLTLLIVLCAIFIAFTVLVSAPEHIMNLIVKGQF